jgi:hypothetical protein
MATKGGKETLMDARSRSMDVLKSFSRRSLAWIVLFMLLFSGLTGFFGWKIWQAVDAAVPAPVVKEAAARSEAFAAAMEKLAPLAAFLKVYAIPAAAGGFLLLGLLLWLLLRGSLARQLRKRGAVSEKADKGALKGKAERAAKAGPAGKKAPASEQAPARPGDEVPDKTELTRMNQLYYLHLLSVLQREGRLLDFFDEDLSRYEDAQIGAAVRSIQDACKKTIRKSISPAPVFQETEGERVTVGAEFDPAAVKLTGNVAGEPPFTGVLQHRGWRAARLELPTLSTTRDPRIIAPAEVEIA